MNKKLGKSLAIFSSSSSAWASRTHKTWFLMLFIAFVFFSCFHGSLLKAAMWIEMCVSSTKKVQISEFVLFEKLWFFHPKRPTQAKNKVSEWLADSKAKYFVWSGEKEKIFSSLENPWDYVIGEKSAKYYCIRQIWKKLNRTSWLQKIVIIIILRKGSHGVLNAPLKSLLNVDSNFLDLIYSNFVNQFCSNSNFVIRINFELRSWLEKLLFTNPIKRFWGCSKRKFESFSEFWPHLRDRELSDKKLLSMECLKSLPPLGSDIPSE